MSGTTKQQSLKHRVAILLENMQGERLHLTQLAEQTQAQPSAVKEAVYKLRDMGYPICSTSDGERSVYYYLSSVDYENRKHAKRPRTMAIETKDAPLVLDFDPFEIGGR